MEERVRAVNKFTLGMTNIKIHYHPLKESAVVTLCDVTRDIYGDTTSLPDTVNLPVQKEMIIIKNTNLEFVNALTGVLQDDGDSLPWIAIFTITDLKRILHKGDFITVGGKKYMVSGVKPHNRLNTSILQCYIHPDRDDFDELVASEPFTIFP